MTVAAAAIHPVVAKGNANFPNPFSFRARMRKTRGDKPTLKAFFTGLSVTGLIAYGDRVVTYGTGPRWSPPSTSSKPICPGLQYTMEAMCCLAAGSAAWCLVSPVSGLSSGRVRTRVLGIEASGGVLSTC